MMTHRVSKALVSGFAIAGAIALSAPPAGAVTATTRLEAETGTIVNANCGPDGPAAAQSGGSGSVVFLPAEGCQITFSGAALRRRPRSIRFFISGETGNMCGRFYVSGGFQGTSGFACVNGTTDTGYRSASIPTTIGDGGADITIEWDVVQGGTGLNAYVDYISLSAIEAEEGTITNSLCGDDGPMRTQGTGTDAVVFYPGNGCSQTFTKESVAPTGIAFAASADACGHFQFTGAWVGLSPTSCDATETWQPLTLVSGVGSTYTVTWRTSLASPPAGNAYLNYITHS